MDSADAGRGYLEHLTDEDLRVLATSAGMASERAGELRGRPGTVLELLGRPELFEQVYGRERWPGPIPTSFIGRERWPGPIPTSFIGRRPAELVRISPFLAFLVAVDQAAREIGVAPFVAERSAPRQQVPVFDTPRLRDFLTDPVRRLFLAELLTSFVRVASGRYWTRTTRGWRSQRYSELDPVRLAQFAEQAPAAHRPGIYRRLGDVSLFLTGVFPDYAQQYALGPFDAARLMRAAGLAPDETGLGAAPPIQLLEHLGQRWYRRAADLAPVATRQMAVVSEVADRFRDARRILNHIADRYFARAGNPWFGPPGR